jgi:hypothetical protein
MLFSDLGYKPLNPQDFFNPHNPHFQEIIISIICIINLNISAGYKFMGVQR